MWILSKYCLLSVCLCVCPSLGLPLSPPPPPPLSLSLSLSLSDRLVGPVVRRPPRERQTWVRFPLSSNQSLKIGAEHHRVSARTGRPGASNQYTVIWWDSKFVLQLLSHCGGTKVTVDPSLRFTSMLPGRSATNNSMYVCLTSVPDLSAFRNTPLLQEETIMYYDSDQSPYRRLQIRSILRVCMSY